MTVNAFMEKIQNTAPSRQGTGNNHCKGGEKGFTFRGERVQFQKMYFSKSTFKISGGVTLRFSQCIIGQRSIQSYSRDAQSLRRSDQEFASNISGEVQSRSICLVREFTSLLSALFSCPSSKELRAVHMLSCYPDLISLQPCAVRLLKESDKHKFL